MKGNSIYWTVESYQVNYLLLSCYHPLRKSLIAAWIGLSREEDGEWEWYDSDEPVNYTNWRNHTDGRRKAVIFQSDGKWRLKKGTGHNHVICENTQVTVKLFHYTA